MHKQDTCTDVHRFHGMAVGKTCTDRADRTDCYVPSLRMNRTISGRFDSSDVYCFVPKY